MRSSPPSRRWSPRLFGKPTGSEYFLRWSSLHLPEHLRNPRPHRDEQACAEPLVERQGRILIVQLGELGLQPPHVLLDDCVRVPGEHAANECEVLASAIEAAAEEIRLQLIPKMSLERPVRPP